MSPTKGMLSFDTGGGFDLPDEQKQFTQKLRLLEKRRQNAVRTNRYRMSGKNLAVGGARYSQHLLGLAADYVEPDMSPTQVAAFMREARDLGLYPVDETVKTKGTAPHIHVQAKPAGTIPRRVFEETP